MDNNSAPAAVAMPAPAAPAPAALPSPVPQMGAPAPSFEGGGQMPGAGPAVMKKPGFFDGVSLSEVLVTGLVVFGLLYSIYYTRQRMAYLTYEQKTGGAGS